MCTGYVSRQYATQSQPPQVIITGFRSLSAKALVGICDRYNVDYTVLWTKNMAHIELRSVHAERVCRIARVKSAALTSTLPPGAIHEVLAQRQLLGRHWTRRH